MKDSLGREIDYLRISITDRCNFNCIYCKNKFEPVSGDRVMTPDEIETAVHVMARLGIKHVRITGGEPLLRDDIADIIKKIRSIKEIETIGLTTNGYYLSDKAESIFREGLNNINVSLDSLSEENFRKITGGDLNMVIQGLMRASLISQSPIKINTVITKYIAPEIVDFLNFARENGFILRFIELMPVEGINFSDLYLPVSSLEERLKDISPIKSLEENFGAGPSRYYIVENFGIKIGIIAAISHKFCNRCNRIRLSSDGMLFSCLSSKTGLNIRKIINDGNEQNLYLAFKELIYNKPPSHNFVSESIHFNMCKLGG